MGVQDLTVQMVVIVVIGVFFASFMDAIAGGGGIISVPTYLLAGLPMHFALGTNKFSSSIGTAFSTGRYIKNGYVDWKLGIPSIVLALIGSFFGTKLQLISMRNEKYPILPGTVGVVTHIDDAGSIHMRWENGSSLALIPEIDSFQTVSKAKK